MRNWVAWLAGLVLTLGTLGHSSGDLKIVTTGKFAGNPDSTTTTYVKGQRTRIEWRNSVGWARKPGDPLTKALGPPMALIYQCDLHRVVQLNLKDREYTSYEIDENGLPVGWREKAVPAQRSGIKVSVTIETIDTGERQEMFGHAARRILQRRKTVAPAGACTQSGESETDGWYIDLDLPERCSTRPKVKKAASAVLVSSGCSGKVDEWDVHRIGDGETGFPVKLTITAPGLLDDSTHSSVSASVTEVIELSEAPLDPELFEVPAGFKKVRELRSQPSMPLSLRLAQWWDGLKAVFRSPFR